MGRVHDAGQRRRGLMYGITRLLNRYVEFFQIAVLCLKLILWNETTLVALGQAPDGLDLMLWTSPITLLGSD